MNTLIIFLKNPEKGKAKTRLAATIGEEAALLAYKELLAQTRSIASAVEAERWLFYKDEIWEDEWSTEYFRKALQSNGDLGIKMQTAFQEVFANGAKRALIIGSDCGNLDAELVEQAFQELETGQDIVVGPAEDGGYYLLGMNKLYTYLFENKSWSTAQLFSETFRDINLHGQTFTILPERYDVDTEAEWERYKSSKNQ